MYAFIERMAAEKPGSFRKALFPGGLDFFLSLPPIHDCMRTETAPEGRDCIV